MMTTKQFFDNLEENEAYMACLMTQTTYAGLELENQERIAASDILIKTSKFDNDDEYKKLSKEYYKAKKAKRNYELNNK